MLEGAIAQNGCVHEFHIYTGKHRGLLGGGGGVGGGGEERVLERYRPDKQIIRKILHVYMNLFFFFFFFFFFFVCLFVCLFFSSSSFTFRVLGPVVQSVVSLTNSSRVILLTVLADPIYNILIFFDEKNVSTAKATHIFQQKNSAYLHISRCKF